MIDFLKRVLAGAVVLLIISSIMVLFKEWGEELFYITVIFGVCWLLGEVALTLLGVI